MALRTCDTCRHKGLPEPALNGKMLVTNCTEVVEKSEIGGLKGSPLAEARRHCRGDFWSPSFLGALKVLLRFCTLNK